MQIGILEPKDFSNKALDMLNSIGEVTLFDGKDLDKYIADKEILFIRLAYFIDKNFLQKTKNLRYICTPTTGLNHIDLEECEKKQIEIVSLKGEYMFLSSIRATPEHTIGLVLSLLRNYKDAFLTGNNPHWDREMHKGFELYENSVGIIGFGRVGKILAKYLKAFGSKTYFNDTDDSIQEIHGAIKLPTPEDVINKSNIVILSASYTESNYQFFDKKKIRLLKNKYFINTARGELVDEEYLIEKIDQNFFKGLALDVIRNEQSNNNLDKLLKLVEKTNLIITPHLAGATYSSMHRTEEFIVNKLRV